MIDELMIHGVLDKAKLDEYYVKKTRNGVDEKNIGRHKPQSRQYRENNDEIKK